MSTSSAGWIAGSLLLALCMSAVGYFIGQGVADCGRGQNVVSVKGLSEKEVPASIVIWTLG